MDQNDEKVLYINQNVIVSPHCMYKCILQKFEVHTFIISFDISCMVFWISGTLINWFIAFITSADLDKLPATRTCAAWPFICISTLFRFALAV